MQSNTAEKYYQLTKLPKAFGIGKLLTTVSDRKLEVEDGSSGTIAYYTADACAEQSRSIISSSDYYPFGFAMDGRDYESNSYRYGFNGMEKDDEVKGSGNSYDFGARIYDSRIGRFLSVDPKAAENPFLSVYSFATNSPIQLIDEYGNCPAIPVYFIVEALLATTSAYVVCEAVNNQNSYEIDRSKLKAYTEQRVNEEQGYFFGDPKGPRGKITRTVLSVTFGVLTYKAVQHAIDIAEDLDEYISNSDETQQGQEESFLSKAIDLYMSQTPEVRGILMSYIADNINDMTDEKIEKINKANKYIEEYAADGDQLTVGQINGLLGLDIENSNDSTSDDSTSDDLSSDDSASEVKR